jgi:hypothetical protein
MVLPTLNITHLDIFFADIVSRSRCCQPQISIFRMFQDNSWHVQYEQTFVGREMQLPENIVFKENFDERRPFVWSYCTRYSL